MNERIKELAKQAGFDAVSMVAFDIGQDLEKFAKMIIEETLNQVDEQCYGRGENQWYYDDDKRWIRLHFGYGELKE